MQSDPQATWKSLAKALAERIASGEMKPGMRLPSGDVLAGQLGVNRNTAHRAVEELQRQGLVVRRKGSGTVIADQPGKDRFRIALLVDGYSPVHNFPHGDLLRGIQDRLGDEGSLLIADSKHDVDVENRQLAKLRREVDGILIYPAAPGHTSVKLTELIELGFPVVVLDRSLRETQVDTVMTDNRGAARKAVASLIERGHRRIGFLSFDKTEFSSVEQRFEGYRDAMTQAGLGEQADLIRWLPSGSDAKMSVFHQVVHDTLFTLRNMGDPITALFCVEDQIGCAVVPACERLGIALPTSLELATFSDWHPMTLRAPWNVHRIVQRKFEMGWEATSLLLDRIASPKRASEIRLVGADLVHADAGLEETLAVPTRPSNP